VSLSITKEVGIEYHKVCSFERGDCLMCGPNGNGIGSACCPPAHFFQEQICGNFNGGTGGIVNEAVFVASPEDYLEGTFQIFNSAASLSTVNGAVITPQGPAPIGPVPPGNTFTIARRNPELFTITAPGGTSGTYCITLYKRVLA
jgi:hypothetical protein